MKARKRSGSIIKRITRTTSKKDLQDELHSSDEKFLSSVPEQTSHSWGGRKRSVSFAENDSRRNEKSKSFGDLIEIGKLVPETKLKASSKPRNPEKMQTDIERLTVKLRKVQAKKEKLKKSNIVAENKRLKKEAKELKKVNEKLLKKFEGKEDLSNLVAEIDEIQNSSTLSKQVSTLSEQVSRLESEKKCHQKKLSSLKHVQDKQLKEYQKLFELKEQQIKLLKGIDVKQLHAKTILLMKQLEASALREKSLQKAVSSMMTRVSWDEEEVDELSDTLELSESVTGTDCIVDPQYGCMRPIPTNRVAREQKKGSILSKTQLTEKTGDSSKGQYGTLQGIIAANRRASEDLDDVFEEEWLTSQLAGAGRIKKATQVLFHDTDQHTGYGRGEYGPEYCANYPDNSSSVGTYEESYNPAHTTSYDEVYNGAYHDAYIEEGTDPEAEYPAVVNYGEYEAENYPHDDGKGEVIDHTGSFSPFQSSSAPKPPVIQDRTVLFNPFLDHTSEQHVTVTGGDIPAFNPFAELVHDSAS